MNEPESEKIETGQISAGFFDNGETVAIAIVITTSAGEARLHFSAADAFKIAAQIRDAAVEVGKIIEKRRHLASLAKRTQPGMDRFH